MQTGLNLKKLQRTHHPVGDTPKEKDAYLWGKSGMGLLRHKEKQTFQEEESHEQ